MNVTLLADWGIDVQAQASLATCSTFRLGGPCLYLLTCRQPEQLEKTVRYLHQEHQNFILIGGGSNLIFSDQGLDTVVIRYVSDLPLIRREGTDLIVSGSTLLDHLAERALEESLEGLNYASGIPGTVGGAIVGNAGAFGRQVGDVLKTVTLLSKSGIKQDVPAESLHFNYRSSNLKERADIVLEARFSLRPGDRQALAREREETLALRREKHPDLQKYPCAGSVFRNIEPTSKAERRQAAGWFLEQAGAKDFSVGGAKIYEKHANIIVKSNGCTAQDVLDLSCLMIKAVQEKFNISLIREVRFVGKFERMPTDVKNIMW